MTGRYFGFDSAYVGFDSAYGRDAQIFLFLIFCVGFEIFVIGNRSVDGFFRHNEGMCTFFLALFAIRDRMDRCIVRIF